MSFTLSLWSSFLWYCLLNEETNMLPWTAVDINVSDDDVDGKVSSPVHEDWTERQVTSGTAAVIFCTVIVTLGTSVVTCDETEGGVLFALSTTATGTHNADVSSMKSRIRSGSIVTSLVVTSSTTVLTTSLETGLFNNTDTVHTHIHIYMELLTRHQICLYIRQNVHCLGSVVCVL